MEKTDFRAGQTYCGCPNSFSQKGVVDNKWIPKQI